MGALAALSIIPMIIDVVNQINATQEGGRVPAALHTAVQRLKQLSAESGQEFLIPEYAQGHQLSGPRALSSYLSQVKAEAERLGRNVTAPDRDTLMHRYDLASHFDKHGEESPFDDNYYNIGRNTRNIAEQYDYYIAENDPMSRGMMEQGMKVGMAPKNMKTGDRFRSQRDRADYLYNVAKQTASKYKGLRDTSYSGIHAEVADIAAAAPR